MLVTGTGHGRNQRETVLQPVGNGEDAHGHELDVGIMSRSGAFEHIWRWIEWILAGREPAPLQTVRTRCRLLNASYLHGVIEEPTLIRATGLNRYRRSRTIERRSFSAGLRVWLWVLPLLVVALLRITLLRRGVGSRLRIGLLGKRRGLLWREL